MMFELGTILTLETHRQLKATLTKILPWVKSSHRAEALARGLGFSTNAALLARMKSEGEVFVIADGEAFDAYLRHKHFDKDSRILYIAVAFEAIRTAMDVEPRLTEWGIGIGQPQRKSDGNRENPREHYQSFLESRKNLLSEHFAEQFLLSLALLARIPTSTKTIRQGAGSYRLKHIAENYACSYPDGSKLGPRYVQNGAMIAAAIHRGFKYKKYVDHLGYDHINTTFNMSKKIIDDLDCEIRPDGAVAQDRRHRSTILLA